MNPADRGSRNWAAGTVKFLSVLRSPGVLVTTAGEAHHGYFRKPQRDVSFDGTNRATGRSDRFTGSVQEAGCGEDPSRAAYRPPA
jgi:hypothetical protein